MNINGSPSLTLFIYLFAFGILHILSRVCLQKCIVVFSHTSPFDVSFVTGNKGRLINGRKTAAPSEGDLREKEAAGTRDDPCWIETELLQDPYRLSAVHV